MRVVQLEGHRIVVQAELRINIASRLMDDFLQTCHLHQRVQMHDMEGEEADCLLVSKSADNQRTSHTHLDLE